LYRHRLPSAGRGASFSPDGRELAALACCEGGSVLDVYAARSGAKIFGHRQGATAFSYSPDGRMLAAGTTDGKVVLWNARDGSEVGNPIQVATEPVQSVSFSHDGRLFASSSSDQTTTLWDLRSRKRLGGSFSVQEGVVPVSQLTAKGDLIAVYLADAAQWPTSWRAWKRHACRVAGRDLTRAEWSDVLPGRAYRHVCPQ
jgi:WD40 repeat protein